MDALIALSSIIYIFWPLLIFIGIRELFVQQRGFLERIRYAFLKIFIFWLVWAILLGLLYRQGRKPILLLPEHLDHLMFFLLGGSAGIVTLGWGLSRWWKRHIRLSDYQTLEDLREMPADTFEALVAALFRAYGYDADIVGGSSDHGVDVLVTVDDDEKWVVQCKRYSGSVGEPVVRDLFGTMSHEGAQRAYLITTGVFTRQARDWAKGKPIVLYDGEALVKLIRRTNKRLKQ